MAYAINSAARTMGKMEFYTLRKVCHQFMNTVRMKVVWSERDVIMESLKTAPHEIAPTLAHYKLAMPNHSKCK